METKSENRTVITAFSLAYDSDIIALSTRFKLGLHWLCEGSDSRVTPGSCIYAANNSASLSMLQSGSYNDRVETLVGM